MRMGLCLNLWGVKENLRRYVVGDILPPVRFACVRKFLSLNGLYASRVLRCIATSDFEG
jgi:hypothetical protein